MHEKLTFSHEQKFSLVPRDGQRPTLTGYAIVWNATTAEPRRDRKGEYYVRIAPGSAEFLTPTFALFHHDYSNVLARNDNGSLRLTKDDIGVKVEIDLPETTLGRDLESLVRGGLVGGMSFAAMPTKFTEKTEDGKRIIEFNSFKCDEVTVTPIPAFHEATVGMKGDGRGLMMAGGDGWEFSDNGEDELRIERYRLERYGMELAELRLLPDSFDDGRYGNRDESEGTQRGICEAPQGIK